MPTSEKIAQNKLRRMVGHLYTEIRFNFEYEFWCGGGEIDFMGRHHDGSWHIYEIKTNPSLRERAIEQLERAAEYIDVSKMFIFYTDTDQLVRYRPCRSKKLLNTTVK